MFHNFAGSHIGQTHYAAGSRSWRITLRVEMLAAKSIRRKLSRQTAEGETLGFSAASFWRIARPGDAFAPEASIRRVEAWRHFLRIVFDLFVRGQRTSRVLGRAMGRRLRIASIDYASLAIVGLLAIASSPAMAAGGAGAKGATGLGGAGGPGGSGGVVGVPNGSGQLGGGHDGGRGTGFNYNAGGGGGGGPLAMASVAQAGVAPVAPAREERAAAAHPEERPVRTGQPQARPTKAVAAAAGVRAEPTAA